jgi:hypothetical protein
MVRHAVDDEAAFEYRFHAVSSWVVDHDVRGAHPAFPSSDTVTKRLFRHDPIDPFRVHHIAGEQSPVHPVQLAHRDTVARLLCVGVEEVFGRTEEQTGLKGEELGEGEGEEDRVAV